MGWLSDLFGGGGDDSPQVVTQTTNSSPWGPQQEYLQDIFGQAQDLYNADGPSYYPDSTVVEFSPESQQALQMTQDRALSGSPLREEAVNQNLAAVRGDYLSAGNPFLQGAYNQAANVVTDQFNNQVAPGIDSQFAGSGRMGSGLYANARNRAEDTLGRNLTEMGERMSYNNYANERSNQMMAMQTAPGMAMTDYQDASQLANVGAAREGQAQAQLQDRVNRYNYDQNQPWNKLAQYSGLVSGGYGSQGSQSTPVYSNTAANFLGGAATGASIGNMVGSPGLGALAGGLLGGFG
jgi:hypothetical protein